MRVIEDSDFANFLSKKPLYYKIKAVSNFEPNEFTYSNPLDFIGKAFKFKCPKENEIQTFRTNLYCRGSLFARDVNMSSYEVNPPIYFDKKTGVLNHTFHVVGHCQSCDEEIDFLINMCSNKSWSERNSGIDIMIQKVGQFPPFEISAEKEVEKYLTSEDSDNYKKALTNLSVSFGIGAFAYFRRIIENEIKRIIEDISTMDFEGVENIKIALHSFEKDHQMANLIDVIDKYLPKSLKELGDNPIKLLYGQLSVGIHNYNDQECLKKAEMIDIVLSYVIKKVNEEKFQISNVKQAMKKLRNG